MMSSQLTFTIKPHENYSNSQELISCTLACLYIPESIDGELLTFLGSVDGIDYYPLDYRIDLTKEENKGVTITNLQNHCCGLRSVKVMTNAPQIALITLYGGLLC